ncbi:unnamed protein product, partial [Rotaria sp. Silwood2]
MSNEKRPSTLFNYNFSSKKTRTGTENLTQDSTTPATTSATVTITTTNDNSSLLLSSVPADLEQISDEVNVIIESNELEVINSRPDTNTNDIGYYLSNKL